MKYLRKFKEDIILYDKLRKEKTEELRKLSKNYLSYIIDNGFDIGIRPTGGIYIGKQNNGGNMITEKEFQEFNWDEIKDDFIPFLNLLCDKYNIDKNITIELTIGSLGDLISPKHIKLIDLLNDSEYLTKLVIRLILIPVR
jgi:hypothetical protein